jgi:hypothetical protein
VEDCAADLFFSFPEDGGNGFLNVAINQAFNIRVLLLIRRQILEIFPEDGTFGTYPYLQDYRLNAIALSVVYIRYQPIVAF